MEPLIARSTRSETGLVSIVVPARDEERVIGRTLQALAEQDYSGRMEIVVAANGCRDGTLEVVARWREALQAAGHGLSWVELPEPGKCAALDAAEERLPPSPRIYLDADVVPCRSAVRRLHAVLTDGSGCHLCAPSIRVERARSAWTRS